MNTKQEQLNSLKTEIYFKGFYQPLKYEQSFFFLSYLKLIIYYIYCSNARLYAQETAESCLKVRCKPSKTQKKLYITYNSLGLYYH